MNEHMINAFNVITEEETKFRNFIQNIDGVSISSKFPIVHVQHDGISILIYLVRYGRELEVCEYFRQRADTPTNVTYYVAKHIKDDDRDEWVPRYIEHETLEELEALIREMTE